MTLNADKGPSTDKLDDRGDFTLDDTQYVVTPRLISSGFQPHGT